MRGWLLILASAGLRDEPVLNDPHNQPEPKSGGSWVWVPASNVEEDAAEARKEQAADAAQAADDAKENEKNQKIAAMHNDVNNLRMVMQQLQDAYNNAETATETVTDNMKYWGDLGGDAPSSLLQTPHEDETKDQLELDESFDGLHALTDRIEKANELLKAHMDKIPDTILAPSTLKELKNPQELFAGASSFLQEPSAEDPADLAEDVREKKWEKKAQADLKDVFSGLEEERADLKKKSGVLTKSLDHLASLTQEDASLPKEPAPNPASLVEARAGHWEWRVHGSQHKAQHHSQHHTQHHAKHHAKQHAKHHRAKLDLPGDTEAEEMKALDDALAPLDKITQSVKAEQAQMASKLSEMAQTAEIENNSNMRLQAD